jgi:hypothetical protein
LPLSFVFDDITHATEVDGKDVTEVTVRVQKWAMQLDGLRQGRSSSSFCHCLALVLRLSSFRLILVFLLLEDDADTAADELRVVEVPCLALSCVIMSLTSTLVLY